MSNKTQRDARVVMGCPAKTWPTLTGSGSSILPPSAKKSNWKKRRTENTLCLFCGKLLTGGNVLVSKTMAWVKVQRGSTPSTFRQNL